MKPNLFKKILTTAGLLASLSSLTAAPTDPIADSNLVFEEVDGSVAIEAEHFLKQEKADVRAWHIVHVHQLPKLKPDIDGPHVKGSSGGAYLEALPDTRWTHGEKLIQGENFFPEPGEAGILSYKVHFNTPGRYYIWARSFSTGPEDNGMHFGLNGEWPESGKRWQTVKKREWSWESKQRTEKIHVGEPFKLYLNIPSAGEHTIQVSMREDGFEFDKFILTLDRYFIPESTGPESAVKTGKAPAAFKVHNDYFEEKVPTFTPKKQEPYVQPKGAAVLQAADFDLSDSDHYLDNGKWLAINPNKHTEATSKATVPVGNTKFHVLLHAVGENDGESLFTLKIGGKEIGTFLCPMSRDTFEEGALYTEVFKNIDINEGEFVEVTTTVASDDGKEYCRGRLAGLTFLPATVDKSVVAAAKRTPLNTDETKAAQEQLALVSITGELKQWHKVTVELEGPQADEMDKKVNPFTDYRFDVIFKHSSGSPTYRVPGYFAADGNAAETSATSGNIWRAHLSPDKTGTWEYEVEFYQGPNASIGDNAGMAVNPFNGQSGTFSIKSSDKEGRDFRSEGRLSYVGKHHLQFEGSGRYFLKAGPDAPETFLAYTGFDNTETRLPKKGPLKSWDPHAQDWNEGDPTWQDGKGKNIIGALNYIAEKGINMFSFLTYNAGGDGDNVWPYVDRDEKRRFDASKLDQWGIIFDHAQQNGLYLHFKLQENESDDNRASARLEPKFIPEALDGGNTGPERKLYLRELIARYGYHLALNWNLGEENTQSPKQQRNMAEYIHETDPYDHLIVIHSFPSQQVKVYPPLLGNQSLIRGASTQNPWHKTHERSLHWIRESAKTGVAWVVPNDEQNPAGLGVPPDPGYKGFSGNTKKDGSGYTLHDIRKLTLWGNLMAGGAGVEYYFGYQLAENDLVAEDLRSRDQSWDFCRIAIDFFRYEDVPFWDMKNADELIGNPSNSNSRFCLAKEDDTYLVYLPDGGTTDIDLSAASGSYQVSWFNPRTGGDLQKGSVTSIMGGKTSSIGNAPADPDEDWAILIKKN